ncbi:hypothetical protein IQ07DRAFT_8591 [Pyrenochaeta sp. DS3sAY3a]|nr:hypothetical protein IQ07DRAFT_8591 [Pyrenochaeta sp. DS3sAY3a]
MPSVEMENFASSSSTPAYNSASQTNAWQEEYKSKSKSKASHDQESCPPVQADYHDPNHPHFVQPITTPSYSFKWPAPSRWPSKRIVIPWLLASLFFLTTAWFTSILVGAKFLSILQSAPSQHVHEVNIVIDGQVFRSVISAPATQTVIVSQTAIPSQTPTTSELPITTGPMHLAPKPGTPPDDNTGNDQGSSLQVRGLSGPAPTTFVTVGRRCS